LPEQKLPFRIESQTVGFRLVLNFAGEAEVGATLPGEWLESKVYATESECKLLFEHLLNEACSWWDKNDGGLVVAKALMDNAAFDALRESISNRLKEFRDPIASTMSLRLEKLVSKGVQGGWVSGSVWSVQEERKVAIEGAEFVRFPFFIRPETHGRWWACRQRLPHDPPGYHFNELYQSREEAISAIFERLQTGKSPQEERYEKERKQKNLVGLAFLATAIGVAVLSWLVLGK